jgi:hypothetical protein
VRSIKADCISEDVESIGSRTEYRIAAGAFGVTRAYAAPIEDDAMSISKTDFTLLPEPKKDMRLFYRIECDY